MTKIETDYEKFKIKIYEADNFSRVKMSSVFNYLQEAATNNAIKIGVGHEELKAEQNLCFVLAKIKLKVLELPKWGENLEVSTWPTMQSKFTAVRDFLIKKNGQDIMFATSVWVLMDLDSRSPVTTDVLQADIKTFSEIRGIRENLKGIKTPNEMNYIYTKEIRFSNIDINNHFNNALYLDAIMDAFSMDFLENHIIEEIQINFIREIRFMENLEVYTADFNGFTIVQGVCNSRNCFIAKIKWMKNIDL